mmetsp:Transcript_38769/g.124275  ORF Transcript_38769/g.124275 Transcript_38769/m.124275 type:complete len:91 (+) Transcript_38769:594-866(+)
MSSSSDLLFFRSIFCFVSLMLCRIYLERASNAPPCDGVSKCEVITGKPLRRPNFYFHLCTAYGILRMAGVDLGKRDYMIHLAPLLKQKQG